MKSFDPIAAGVPAHYDPAAASAFFESAGRTETAAGGAMLFAENQKGSRWLMQRDKMYYLVEGEIALSINGKVIDTLRAGEVFGEMSAIGDLPRSDCRLIALDESQFRKALRAQPEFALAIMNVMIARLRFTVAALGLRGGLGRAGGWSEGRTLEPKLVAQLRQAMGEPQPIVHPRNKVILSEGTAAAFLYIVLAGTVAISIQSKTVEKIGPGGVFGELALVDQGPRVATAVAETDCELLSIGRSAFLQLIASKPEFGLALLKAFAQRLRYLNAHFK